MNCIAENLLNSLQTLELSPGNYTFSVPWSWMFQKPRVDCAREINTRIRSIGNQDFPAVDGKCDSSSLKGNAQLLMYEAGMAAVGHLTIFKGKEEANPFPWRILANNERVLVKDFASLPNVPFTVLETGAKGFTLEDARGNIAARKERLRLELTSGELCSAAMDQCRVQITELNFVLAQLGAIGQ